MLLQTHIIVDSKIFSLQKRIFRLLFMQDTHHDEKFIYKYANTLTFIIIINRTSRVSFMSFFPVTTTTKNENKYRIIITWNMFKLPWICIYRETIKINLKGIFRSMELFQVLQYFRWCIKFMQRFCKRVQWRYKARLKQL